MLDERACVAGRGRRPAPALPLLLLLLLAVSPRIAEAQAGGASTGLPLSSTVAPPANPDDERAAREGFDRGNQALRAGDHVAAAAAYRDALAHWDHPCIRYNLVLALMKQDAFVELTEVIAAGPSGPAMPDTCEDALANLRPLADKMVTDVVVAVPQPGATLYLDGKPVFVGPGTWRARVVAGRHTLQAEAPGMETAVYAQPFPGGSTLELTMNLYTAIDEPWIDRRPVPRWFGYAIVGVGLEAVVAGGLLHYGARSAADEYERRRDACPPGDVACPVAPDLLAVRDASHARRGAAFALYGAGAGLVVVGAALVWYERPRVRWRPPSTAQARVELLPIVGADRAGFVASGSF